MNTFDEKNPDPRCGQAGTLSAGCETAKQYCALQTEPAYRNRYHITARIEYHERQARIYRALLIALPGQMSEDAEQALFSVFNEGRL